MSFLMFLLSGWLLNTGYAHGMPDASAMPATSHYGLPIKKSNLYSDHELLYWYSSGSAGGMRKSLPQDWNTKLILNKARNAIYERLNKKAYRVRLSVRWMPRRLEVLDPRKIQAVELDDKIGRYTNFNVVFQQHTHMASTQIQLEVEADQLLPVAKRRLKSGAFIQADDLEMRWTNIDPGRDRFLPDMKSIVGQTLRRTLLAQEPIRSSDIGGAYIVKAGEEIQLLYQEDGVRIAISGTARQHGVKGDIISIYSRETRQNYKGIITAPGEAKWYSTN